VVMQFVITTRMDELRSSEGAGHLPVLPREIVELLAPREGLTMLDCTVGRGGHASIIAPMLSTTGRYIALDMDEGNLAFAKQRVAGIATPCNFIHANFADTRDALDAVGIERVDLLLADLGFASNQI